MAIQFHVALTVVLLVLPILTTSFQLQSSPHRATTQLYTANHHHHPLEDIQRRTLLLAPIPLLFTPFPAHAALSPTSTKRCTDIDSCREIGDQKDAADLQANPVTRLKGGIRYKVLQPGVGGDTVKEGSSIDLIYTLSRAGGQYMYSQGFGYELVDVVGDGTLVKDVEESLRVTVGRRQVPIGIEEVLKGMKKGERRRVELPPAVGLETSNWEPAPKTTAGKQSIVAYRRILEGFGSQPAFSAPTIWDIEVLRIRN